MEKKTYAEGHFHQHNEDVKKKLLGETNLKQAVKKYALQIADDAIMLHKAGASDEQIASSRAALESKFDEAWAAMTHGTDYK